MPKFRVDPGPTTDELSELEADVLGSRDGSNATAISTDKQGEEPHDDWFGRAAHDTVQGQRPPARRREPYRFLPELGVMGSGPKPMGKAERSRFLGEMEKIIQSLKRSS